MMRHVSVSESLFPVPPVVLVPPASETAAIGDRMVMSCTAEGVPLASVSWLHNANPVRGSDAVVQSEIKGNVIGKKVC
jgi:Immunoglobulin domain